MSTTFRTTRRIEFRDTDAAGIAHFSAFFLYMEQVEHEFLRSLGLSVMTSDADGPISWPRVAAQCDYQGPARFEDVLDVELQVARLGEKSISYECCFTHAGRDVAVGKLTAVCCRMEPTGARAIIIPDWIRSKLAPWQIAP
jgi:4-hydroxybenzoyl-CoA thioesterase/acyl-CoA thioester hydrolase